jgi:sRNA-binding regulator protein Hfq
MDREKNGLNDEEPTLLELFKRQFPEHSLTTAEERLLLEVEKGEVIDYSSDDSADNDPGNAEEWGNERTISASALAWLCTDRVAANRVPHKGIQVRGAKVVEPLDLSFADVSFPLGLLGCAFTESLFFLHSRIKALALNGSRTQTISADGIDVKGDVFLRDGFKAKGEVRLLCATIGATLDCSKGQFIKPDGAALSADGIDVKGSVFLRDAFKAEGEVRLLNATIGATLDCSKGQFIKPDGVALNADGIDVKGDVFLRDGFKAKGEVRLLGATLGATLDCLKGQFIKPDGAALSAEGMDVKGSVFLRDGFKAEGEVRLLGVTIGRQLNCKKGQFIKPKGDALNTDGMDVKGSVFLSDGFKAEGNVGLTLTVVAQGLQMRNVLEPEKARFDFTSTTIDTLLDDEASWPAKGNLVLDGFVYRRLAQQAPHNVKVRIRWLRLQPTDRFYPHPYEQLAKVLQESGYVDAAKRVLIAKNKDPAKLRELSRPKRFLHRFVLGGVTGYGYRPWRALWIGAALVLIGWGLFFAAGREGIMVPVQSEAVTANMPFCAPAYVIDTFVPLVDLEQAHYWTPHVGRSGTLFTVGNYALPLSGLFLRVVAWVLNILGWALTTLLVTGLTGVIRRRFDY